MEQEREDYADPEPPGAWDLAGRRVACCIVAAVVAVLLVFLVIALAPLILRWAPA